MHTKRFAILALMTLHGAVPAAAANIRDHIEKVRIEAPVVYVGHVDAVETLGRTKFHVQARATVRVARMFRGAAPATTAKLRYSSWDDSTPPLVGGPQYRLRQGSLALAFASSLDATMPPGYLVHGEPGYLVDMVNRWKQSLAGMSLGQWAIDRLPPSERPLAETLREGVTEENRRSQLRLYDEILAFLHEHAGAAGDPQVLTCAYVSAAGGKARVRVERKAEEVVLVSVNAVPAELTLRKRGASGGALKVVRWEATPAATEIAFAAPGEPPGRVSFEEQEGSFLIEVRGAPPAIRQALRLEGGWFALVLRPGEPDCRMATVGMATLKPNGELHMQWRSWDRGMLAESFEIVKPGDPRHAAYLRHVGGLNPGETKPIPAFEPPDATSR